MLITLIRHAQVQEEYQQCYNGHIDISLSEKGKEDAKKLGLYFKGKNFDALFCSDLKRCKQTLAEFELNIKPVYTRALREKSWGRHEGKSFDEIIKSEEFEYENFEQWLNALDGEKFTEYIKRIENFFRGFLLANPYEHVLIITHAGVIKVLMYIFQNISLEEAFAKSFSYSSFLSLNTDNWSFTEIKSINS